MSSTIKLIVFACSFKVNQNKVFTAETNKFINEEVTITNINELFISQA